MRKLMLAGILVGLVELNGGAADWPLAGSDAGRTGFTTDELPANLALRWTYHAPHAPQPAWPRSDRQPFDRAYHPVIAGGVLYYGSSADGKVYALDAATGKERWSFLTGGPIRFAPAVVAPAAAGGEGGVVFAASDDGFLYCLAAADGKLLWQQRGGPSERMLLGNDRLISHWPARGGPVVADGIVYFAAGIWPSDGIYLYALDAKTGKVLWVNDKSGSIYMGQPHGGANAVSGVAAQGYLLASGDQLLVPTGRAVPAAFNRITGQFQYFHLQQYGHKGGATALAVGAHFVNSGSLFDAPTGAMLETLGPGAVAAIPDGIVRSTDKELIAYRFADKQKTDKKGVVSKYRGLDKTWSVAGAPGGVAVLAAGKHIVTAGGGRIGLIDAEAKAVVWSADVDGVPYALAAAAGRLYVSTDKGMIYCFAAKSAEKPVVIKSAPQPAPYGDNTLSAAAAKEIIVKTGITEGFCVDLGCGDGALAYELARRTKLQIYAVDADPEKVAKARRLLEAAGLYGVRVTVHQAELDKLPYPRYFANLVVSGRSLTEGPQVVPAEELQRLQRPFGGVACIGKPAEMRMTVRGPLEGAGAWTHQYADPANSCCSNDQVVKGPLKMLWFRDCDLDMPQRHGRGPAPLYLDGRLFVEGLNAIRAVDAYNGRVLWEHSMPQILKPYNGEHLMGTAGTGSNYCVSTDGVYVRAGDRCLRLDVASGKKLAEFEAPKLPGGKAGTWGYIAVDKGTLFGSLVVDQHIVRWRFGQGDMSLQFTESQLLFALDALTGKLKWTYQAEHAIRHNAIAIAAGRVYLIDRPLAEGDRITLEKGKVYEHPKGVLRALDVESGKVVWKSAEDIFGTVLAASAKHDAVVMSYQPTSFRLPSEKGGQLAVFRASDGKSLWNKTAAYTTRPLLNDRTIFAQGGTWDLLTGDNQKWDLKRSYGCGQLAGSAHLMVYRSATLGYHDLLSPAGTQDFGGIRPGCWINAIPAGGIVLVPDASAGCQCSYLNQAWMALQPAE